VISSPYFIFDKLKPGEFAHGDTSTGRYEVKFRQREEDQMSQVACLLRHRDIVTSYIPLNEEQNDIELNKLSNTNKMGTLYCDVIFLGSKPKIQRLKIKLKNVVPFKEAEYS
jgi:hypothetical protein